MGFAFFQRRPWVSVFTRPRVILLALFIIHVTTQLTWNHMAVSCPHHGLGVEPDVHYIASNAVTGRYAMAVAQSTSAAGAIMEPLHPSMDILYSPLQEEVLDITSEEIEMVGDKVVDTVAATHAYFGGSLLYGYALSRHVNFHLVDEHSIGHFGHGILCALLVYWLATRAVHRPQHHHHRHRLLQYGLVVAVVLEMSWEVVENRPSSNRVFDLPNLLRCSDSILNSIGDVLSMMAGYLWLGFLHKRLQRKVGIHHRKRIVRFFTSFFGLALLHLLLIESFSLCVIKTSITVSFLQFVSFYSGLGKLSFLAHLEHSRQALVLGPYVHACGTVATL